HLQLPATRRRFARQHLVHRSDVRDRLLGIDGADDLPNRGYQRSGLTSVSNDEVFRIGRRRELLWRLRRRKVNLRLAGPLEPPNPDVADYADDGADAAAMREGPADRILSRPVPLAKRRADDRHPCLVAAIAIGDVAAAQERNAHRR